MSQSVSLATLASAKSLKLQWTITICEVGGLPEELNGKDVVVQWHRVHKTASASSKKHAGRSAVTRIYASSHATNFTEPTSSRDDASPKPSSARSSSSRTFSPSRRTASFAERNDRRSLAVRPSSPELRFSRSADASTSEPSSAPLPCADVSGNTLRTSSLDSARSVTSAAATTQASQSAQHIAVSVTASTRAQRHSADSTLLRDALDSSSLQDALQASLPSGTVSYRATWLPPSALVVTGGLANTLNVFCTENGLPLYGRSKIVVFTLRTLHTSRRRRVLGSFRYRNIARCSIDLASFTQSLGDEVLSLPMKFCNAYLDDNKPLRNSPNVNDELRPTLHFRIEATLLKLDSKDVELCSPSRAPSTRSNAPSISAMHLAALAQATDAQSVVDLPDVADDDTGDSMSFDQFSDDEDNDPHLEADHRRDAHRTSMSSSTDSLTPQGLEGRSSLDFRTSSVESAEFSFESSSPSSPMRLSATLSVDNPDDVGGSSGLSRERVGVDELAVLKKRVKFLTASDIELRSQLKQTALDLSKAQEKVDMFSSHLTRVRVKRDLLQERVLDVEQQLWACQESAKRQSEKDHSEMMQLHSDLDQAREALSVEHSKRDFYEKQVLELLAQVEELKRSQSTLCRLRSSPWSPMVPLLLLLIAFLLMYFW
eukprot:CAMPEP_0177658712 /NCGR_PEP_ID=MMETSP0447-20121125/16995_1 /TAXON_ID=0 /ORGANISM="Stygamoeba regulata, Strain BSH-02190019" /LENGTH=656 /DNA_ID=CAMNT_0019163413 /DNA_START=43 /DNA_END=2013 /DNA_ORIENTATION=+